MDFLQSIKSLIENNKDIVSVTNRGLENADGRVVFVAKNLLKRYPELQKCFIKEEIPIKEEPIVEEEVPKTKKKTKKK